jgi:hypothetical protein
MGTVPRDRGPVLGHGDRRRAGAVSPGPPATDANAIRSLMFQRQEVSLQILNASCTPLLVRLGIRQRPEVCTARSVQKCIQCTAGRGEGAV